MSGNMFKVHPALLSKLPQDLVKEYEEVYGELDSLITSFNASYERILKKSQELDKLISKMQKIILEFD